MKKQFRVKKSSEFKKILDLKLVAGRNTSFSVFYLDNQLGYGRIGISVSKKIINAVGRSKIRRQVRHMINQSEILKSSYDIIIIVKEGFLTLNFSENQKNLNHILDNLIGRTNGNQKEKK